MAAIADRGRADSPRPSAERVPTVNAYWFSGYREREEIPKPPEDTLLRALA